MFSCKCRKEKELSRKIVIHLVRVWRLRLWPSFVIALLSLSLADWEKCRLSVLT